MDNNDKIIKVLTLMLSAVKGADRSVRVPKIVEMMTVMIKSDASMIYRIHQDVARFRQLLSDGEFDGWYWSEPDASKLKAENQQVVEELQSRFAWLLTN